MMPVSNGPWDGPLANHSVKDRCQHDEIAALTLAKTRLNFLKMAVLFVLVFFRTSDLLCNFLISRHN